MQYGPGIRDVVRGVHEILLAHRLEIDQRLQRVSPEAKVGAILDFWTSNVDTGMYHLLMIEMSTESGKWVAMPEIAEDTFSLTIWGLVHHEDDRLLDGLIGEFTGGVKDALNRRHHPIQIQGGFEMFFNDTKPIGDISYGATQLGSSIVRGFLASWTSSVTFQIRDASSYGPAETQIEDQPL